MQTKLVYVSSADKLSGGSAYNFIVNFNTAVNGKRWVLRSVLIDNTLLSYDTAIGISISEFDGRVITSTGNPIANFVIPLVDVVGTEVIYNSSGQFQQSAWVSGGVVSQLHVSLVSMIDGTLQTKQVSDWKMLFEVFEY
jgi:hypothetical protein